VRHCTRPDLSLVCTTILDAAVYGICNGRWTSLGWVNTSGAAEISYCEPKSRSRFAWEVNPVRRFDGTIVDYYGCISDECCSRIKETMSSWELSLLLLEIFAYVAAVAAVWCDGRLLNLPDDDDQDQSDAHKAALKKQNLGVLALTVLVALFLTVDAAWNSCGNVSRVSVHLEMLRFKCAHCELYICWIRWCIN
jgi:hypothetical protein